jgi:uncharacterized protein
MFKYKVEVKVATNPEMGLGLFSKEFIPKGTIVWEFVEGIDVKISEEKFQTLNDAQKEFFYKYGWREEDGFYYSSSDLTNFINHSYEPNIEVVGDFLITKSDIEIGDELFGNYGEFDVDFDSYKDTYY